MKRLQTVSWNVSKINKLIPFQKDKYVVRENWCSDVPVFCVYYNSFKISVDIEYYTTYSIDIILYAI